MVQAGFIPSKPGRLQHQRNASIRENYATGAVTGSSQTGGLIGRFADAGSLNNVADSYRDITRSGQTTDGLTGALCGTAVGKTSAHMLQQATFLPGFDVSADRSSSGTWRIYEGQTSPLLRNFFKPLDDGRRQRQRHHRLHARGFSALILLKRATPGTSFCHCLRFGQWAASPRGIRLWQLCPAFINKVVHSTQG